MKVPFNALQDSVKISISSNQEKNISVEFDYSKRSYLFGENLVGKNKSHLSKTLSLFPDENF